MDRHTAPRSEHHEWGLADTLIFPWQGRPRLMGFRDELLPVGREVLHGGSLGVPGSARAVSAPCELALLRGVAHLTFISRS